MAYHFTCSRVQQPSEIECSDVEPSDVAPVAATSSSSSFVGSSVVAVGEPESMATEPAEPVSVPIHPSPVGRPSFQRGLGVPGPAGPPRVGVSLGYPSSLAGPSEMSAHSHDQLSSSSIATVVDTPPSSSLAAAPYQQNSLETEGLAFERKEETEDAFNVELFQTKAQHVMVKLNS